jgi:DNA-binding transcriptional LysR family regulator
MTNIGMASERFDRQPRCRWLWPMKTTSEDFAVFVCVVESGSITAASQSLGLAPSAVSRTLSKLEEKVGTTLLNRTTRRMRLTEEGAFVLDHAKEILHRLEHLEESLTWRLHVPVGRLRINAATAFMLHAIVPHVGEFRLLHPGIELQLNTSECDIDLLAENADIAIRVGSLSDSTLRARLLGAAQLHMVASPDYVALHGSPTSVQGLAGHSLIGFSGPESQNLWPVMGSDGKSFQARPALSASSGEMIRQLALAGQGIACLAGFMTEKDVAAGCLVRLMPDAMKCQLQPVHAVFYRNSALSIRVQCFLDFIEPRLKGMLVPP